MTETISGKGNEQASGNAGREAVWQSGPEDVAMPVRIAETVQTRSGKKFVRLEGSNMLVPASEIQELPSGSEKAEEMKAAEDAGELATEQVVEAPARISQEQDGGEERQMAIAEIVELLDEREAKATQAKEASKKGNHDAKIALYKALREAVKKGAFDEIVKATDTSGNEMSPRKFVTEIYAQAKKHTDELIEAVDNRGREDLRPQLEKAYKLYDLAEGALTALEKVEASQQSASSGSEETPEPQESAPASEVSEEQKEEQAPKPESDKPDYKFQKGETVKVRTRRGNREFDWKVNRSFTGKHQRVYVRLIDPGGKYPERVVPQDQLEEWNPRASSQESEPVQQPAENESAPASDSEVADSSSSEAASETPPPDNSAETDDGGSDNAESEDDGSNNTNNDPETQEDIGESPWLDPRRIQELKAAYKDLIRSKKAELGGVVPKEFHDIAKTHIIETAIRNAIGHAEYVKNKHNVGEMPNAPSEAIKRRMAEMMDISDDQLNNMAEQADEQASEQNSRFKKGQEVKIISSNGEVSEGWRVEGYKQHYRHGNLEVIVSNGREKRYYSPGKLQEFQEQANPDQDKINLEKLKPFFNGPAKVKTDIGIIEGQFQGYSIKNKGVYIGDAEGKRIGNAVPVEEFLSWQGEKTVTELEAEKQAQEAEEQRLAQEAEEKRLEELERKINSYIGKKVKVKDDEDKWVSGFKCSEYLKDDQKVRITHESGPSFAVPVELFIKWQEEPGGEETIADEPKAGEDEGSQRSPDAGGEPSPAVPKPLERTRQEREQEKQRLSWWESTKEKYDKLSNPKKVAVGFLGLVAVSTLPGMAGAAVIAGQHKRHHARIEKRKRKEAVANAT